MKTFKYTSCVSFSNVPATLQEIVLNTKCKLFLFCFSGGPVVKKPFAMQKSQVRFSQPMSNQAAPGLRSLAPGPEPGLSLEVCLSMSP